MRFHFRKFCIADIKLISISIKKWRDKYSDKRWRYINRIWLQKELDYWKHTLKCSLGQHHFGNNGWWAKPCGTNFATSRAALRTLTNSLPQFKSLFPSDGSDAGMNIIINFIGNFVDNTKAVPVDSTAASADTNSINLLQSLYLLLNT